MGDVHGGLLKCVLQLAACSDKVRRAVCQPRSLNLRGHLCLHDVLLHACVSWKKLRTTDALLGKFVSGMQRDLPLAELPTLVLHYTAIRIYMRSVVLIAFTRVYAESDAGGRASEPGQRDAVEGASL